MSARAPGSALLAALCALAGCSGGQKAARPAPPSLRGQEVFVTCTSPAAWREPHAEAEVCEALADAFEQSGMPPVTDKARAELTVQATVSFHGDWTEYQALGAKGAVLDGARFGRDDCGTFATGGATARCVALKIVADVVESKRIQAWGAEHGGLRKGPAARPALTAAPRLAVLELRSKLKGRDADLVDPAYFADLARGAVLRALPGVQVITKENLMVLLQAQGKSLTDCEGECEVDTGRMVGADLVVSGEVLRSGGQLKINLKLHETAGGQLRGQTVASGRSAEELEKGTEKAIGELVADLR